MFPYYACSRYASCGNILFAFESSVLEWRFEKLEHLFPFHCCQIDFLHVLATYLQVFLPSSCHTLPIQIVLFYQFKKFLPSSYQFKKNLAKFLQFEKFQTKFLPIQKFLPSCQLPAKTKKVVNFLTNKNPPSCRHWPQVSSTSGYATALKAYEETLPRHLRSRFHDIFTELTQGLPNHQETRGCPFSSHPEKRQQFSRAAPNPQNPIAAAQTPCRT